MWLGRDFPALFDGTVALADSMSSTIPTIRLVQVDAPGAARFRVEVALRLVALIAIIVAGLIP